MSSAKENENVIDTVSTVSKKSENEDEFEEKNWLKYHIEPFEEIKKKWQASFKLRREEILNVDSSNENYLSNILKEWPIFSQSFGHSLVSIFILRSIHAWYLEQNIFISR